MGALTRQHGGTHYTDQEMQPIELAYLLGATPAFCKVAKYATRIKDDPIQQLDKAIHCGELEEELIEEGSYIRKAYAYAKEKIYEFTDNLYLRQALLSLYYGHYTNAIYNLELMKENL